MLFAEPELIRFYTSNACCCTRYDEQAASPRPPIVLAHEVYMRAFLPAAVAWRMGPPPALRLTAAFAAARHLISIKGYELCPDYKCAAMGNTHKMGCLRSEITKAREHKRTHAKCKTLENKIMEFYPAVNNIRLGLKQRAKAKNLTFCCKFNAKAVPCPRRCKYSPCCEWEELLKTDILKGSIYEDPMFMPSYQGKNQMKENENPYHNY